MTWSNIWATFKAQLAEKFSDTDDSITAINNVMPYKIVVKQACDWDDESQGWNTPDFTTEEWSNADALLIYLEGGDGTVTTNGSGDGGFCVAIGAENYSGYTSIQNVSIGSIPSWSEGNVSLKSNCIFYPQKINDSFYGITTAVGAITGKKIYMNKLGTNYQVKSCSFPNVKVHYIGLKVNLGS